ncbi:nitroreductase family protein [Desulfosporosinus sp. PR]|uniref:nitroreductase family protein n=1 Tax=Candidatus Desulfosporosinus nitrosoreducens TaxID=3401928 RepID=UPI0027EB2EAA|nr:nitroreductase family protein [Desulfosporosinus sp. PR]MDQ7097191.1 nitroreductase family protein [Desulfosporosinus sp. PR]
MNQTIETIMKRKGTLSYTGQQIKDSDRDTIISCGIAGPTARNLQNRHFTVVQKQELLQQINDGVRTVMSAPAEYNPLYGAPTLIVMSAPIEALFADQDCAIAVENMSLTATALGLGSRYIVSPTRFIESDAGKMVKQALGIPEGYRSVACLIVGYDANPAQAPTARNMDVVNYVK